MPSALFLLPYTCEKVVKDLARVECDIYEEAREEVNRNVV
jgi:hypothetical protein